MTGLPDDAAVAPPFGLTRRGFLVFTLVVCAGVPFVLGALLGGDTTDVAMLRVVWFMALLMWALVLVSSYGISRFCSHSRRRWLFGQVSVAIAALGAGLIWSAAAIGAGFVIFMVGAFFAGLLMLRERQSRRNRRS